MRRKRGRAGYEHKVWYKGGRTDGERKGTSEEQKIEDEWERKKWMTEWMNEWRRWEQEQKNGGGRTLEKVSLCDMKIFIVDIGRNLLVILLCQIKLFMTAERQEVSHSHIILWRASTIRNYRWSQGGRKKEANQKTDGGTKPVQKLHNHPTVFWRVTSQREHLQCGTLNSKCNN